MRTSQRKTVGLLATILLSIGLGLYVTWTMFVNVPKPVVLESQQSMAVPENGQEPRRSNADSKVELDNERPLTLEEEAALIGWQDPPDPRSGDDRVLLELQVVDPEGHPLPGVEVRIGVHTDFVPTADLQRVVPDGEAGMTDDSGCYRSRRAGRIFTACAIEDGRRVSEILVFKKPRHRVILPTLAQATLRVRVLERDGTPVPQAIVMVSGAPDIFELSDSIPDSSQRFTDLEGWYRRSIPVEVPVVVTARHKRKQSNHVEITATEAGQVLDVKLEMSGRFGLTAEIAEGLENSTRRVTLFTYRVPEESVPEFNPMNCFIQELWIPATARQILPGPGNYGVLAYDDRRFATSLTTFSVTAEHPQFHLRLDLKAIPRGRVRVLDSGNRPIVGASVSGQVQPEQMSENGRLLLGLLGQGTVGNFEKTDEAGEVEFSLLHDQLVHRLQVRAPDSMSAMAIREGVHLGDGVTEIRFEPKEERLFRIVGRVTRDPDGATVRPSKVFLSCRNAGFEWRMAQIRDHDGHFDIENVHGGLDYDLAITAPGCAPFSYEILDVDRDLDLDLVVESAGLLNLEFVDESGRVMPYVEFQLRSAGRPISPSQGRACHADKEGHASVQGLPSGDYEIVDLVTSQTLGSIKIEPGATMAARIVVHP